MFYTLLIHNMHVKVCVFHMCSSVVMQLMVVAHKHDTQGEGIL